MKISTSNQPIRAAGLLAVLCAACGLCGCTSYRLPSVRAEMIQQTTSFPGFASTVDASGIRVTEATVTAAEVQWRVSCLGFTSVTLVKGYQRKREKDEL
jgi:hypothetical protein